MQRSIFWFDPAKTCFSRRPIFPPASAFLFLPYLALFSNSARFPTGLDLFCPNVFTAWSIGQKQSLWAQANRINASCSWLGFFFFALPFSRCIACCWTPGLANLPASALIQPKFIGSHSSTSAICTPSSVRHAVPAARIVIHQDPSLISFSGLPSAGEAFSQPLEGVSWASFRWARTRPAQNKKGLFAGSSNWQLDIWSSWSTIFCSQ